MKFTNYRLLSVSILAFVYSSFISSALAVQPGWTKAQVIEELGQPDNRMEDSTYGEVWTYNTTPRNKSFFDSQTGLSVISNVVDLVMPEMPIGNTMTGYKVYRGIENTTSTAADEALTSTLESKNPGTTSVVVIHFDSDGRVAEPRMYHGTPGTSTVQTPITSGESPQNIGNGDGAKYKERVPIGSRPVMVREPKHVYVDSEDVCHRPYCKKIVGIEKRAMKRFATLEQALQAKNKKCDSCMATE